MQMGYNIKIEGLKYIFYFLFFCTFDYLCFKKKKEILSGKGNEKKAKKRVS